MSYILGALFRISQSPFHEGRKCPFIQQSMTTYQPEPLLELEPTDPHETSFGLLSAIDSHSDYQKTFAWKVHRLVAKPLLRSCVAYLLNLRQTWGLPMFSRWRSEGAPLQASPSEWVYFKTLKKPRS